MTKLTADTTVTKPVVAKVPSKKSLALAIFQEKMTERSHSLFGSNKEFRAAVLTSIMTTLSVSTASAATMYNQAKKDAEAADATVKLGRDPKKVKAPSTGKRGRPAGKAKTVTVDTIAATAEVTPVTA